MTEYIVKRCPRFDNYFAFQLYRKKDQKVGQGNIYRSKTEIVAKLPPDHPKPINPLAF